MSNWDGSVYKMLSSRPLARLHAKLDLIWHLFSNINILFWWENSFAVPLTAGAWWMMPEMEEAVFIFSRLSTCRADWNGHAIVYKFFWSDPSLWTYHSQPWPLRAPSYWPEAAVYTLPCTYCKSNESQLSVPFTTLPAYLHTFVRNVFLALHFFSFSGLLFSCLFQLQCPSVTFFSVIYVQLSYLEFVPQSPVLVYLWKKLKGNFTAACHSFYVQAG